MSRARVVDMMLYFLYTIHYKLSTIVTVIMTPHRRFSHYRQVHSETEGKREMVKQTSERWNESAQAPASFHSVMPATAEEVSDSEVSEIAPRLTPHLFLINALLS